MTLAVVNTDSVSDTATAVRAAQGGDRQAFGALVEEHWTRLVRLTRSVVGETDAEDIAQESLVVAWQRLASLRDPGHFAPWLLRLAFRRSLRHARRSRGAIALCDAPEPSHSPDPGVGLDAWRILARLAPRQRAVMHLTAVEGMSDGEIAVALGITAASVRSHRRRAREAVERWMQGGVQ